MRQIKYFFNFSFIFEIVVFFLTLFLSLELAFLTIKKTVASQQFVQAPSYSAWQFILLIIGTTALMLLVLKYSKRPWLIQGIFYLVIFDGLWFFSQSYLSWPSYLFFLLLLILMWIFNYNVLIHNILLVITLSSVAVILGFSLLPSSAIIILLFMAFYDFWAVYKTKHMVTMFRGMAESKIHFAFIIPQNFKGLLTKVKEVNLNQDFMFLGTGDVALPAVFMVTCLKINLQASIFSGLGAVLGFILLYVIFTSQKERKPMPGLPPIILGTLLGYLISFFI